MTDKPESIPPEAGYENGHRANRLKQLIAANQALARVESVAELFPLLIHLARDVTGAEAASLMRFFPEKGVLMFAAVDNDPGVGTVDVLKEKIALKLGEGVAGWVGQRRRSANIPDARQDPRFSHRADRETGFVTHSILCVPILYRDQLLGVVNVFNKKDGNAFDELDQEILEAFAGLAAVAVVRANLLEAAVSREKARGRENAAAIVESAADAIVTFTPKDLRVIWQNPAAETVFGYPEENFAQLSLPDLLDLSRDPDYQTQVLSGDLVQVYGLARGGGPFPMEAVVTRVGHGQDRFLVGTFRDVTRRDEDQRKLREELTKAARYVKSQLPPPVPGGRVATDWRFVPCSSLGGDSLGYHWLNDRLFAFYLLDVAGHGVDSALLAMSVASALRTGSLARADFSRPSQVLEALNRAFPMDPNEGKFLTIFYGVYDALSRELRYTTGGHPPALLLPPGKGASALRLDTENTIVAGIQCDGFEEKN
ncbi:MAG: SpoIIE family protein phosphatase, partial [Pseudomonadota bacterium]